jgi:hypothetical protein
MYNELLLSIKINLLSAIVYVHALIPYSQLTYATIY